MVSLSEKVIKMVYVVTVYDRYGKKRRVATKEITKAQAQEFISILKGSEFKFNPRIVKVK